MRFGHPPRSDRHLRRSVRFARPPACTCSSSDYERRMRRSQPMPSRRTACIVAGPVRASETASALEHRCVHGGAATAARRLLMVAASTSTDGRLELSAQPCDGSCDSEESTSTSRSPTAVAALSGSRVRPPPLTARARPRRMLKRRWFRHHLRRQPSFACGNFSNAKRAPW